MMGFKNKNKQQHDDLHVQWEEQNLNQHNKDLSIELELLLESENDRELFIKNYFKGRRSLALSIHRFRIHKLNTLMSYEQFEQVFNKDPEQALAKLNYRINTEDTVDYLVHRVKERTITIKEIYSEISAKKTTSLEMIFPLRREFMA